MPTADGREERAGRNETLFREVNEQVAQLYEEQEGGTELLQFVCECSLPDCHEHISLTRSDYERVRAQPRRFAVRPEHVSNEIERVVAEVGEGWVMVEKFGEAGERAERGFDHDAA
jgi:hypothetical protein